MEQFELQKIAQAIDELSGQCLAFQALLSSIPEANFDYEKAKGIITATPTPFGSNASSIARNVISVIEKKHMKR